MNIYYVKYMGFSPLENDFFNFTYFRNCLIMFCTNLPTCTYLHTDALISLQMYWNILTKQNSKFEV